MLARSLFNQPAALFGVVFLRRSPERLAYSRQRLLLAIGLACPAAYVTHVWMLGLDTPQALLKMVCELIVLVMGLRLARISHATSGQYRLLVMTLTLFLISLFGDVLLIALSTIPLQSPLGSTRQLLAFGTMISMALGAANTVQYGMSIAWRTAAFYILGYIALTMMLYGVTSLALAG